MEPLPYQELTEALRSELGGNLVAAVLFGSHARGTASDDSDVDLLLVLRREPAGLGERLNLVAHLTAQLQAKFHRSFDLVLFDRRTLRDNFRLFAPLCCALVLDLQVLFDRQSFFAQEFRKFLAALAKTRRRCREGGVTWPLNELAKEFANSRASSLEPLCTT